ncbi:hypothetical protein [Paenibacillus terrae]|uniref:Phage ABA sandwich domain-containing protein n=1 Tax=Paenibacillus terrae TaxID=159743 RepID=A0A0D7X059_9BACL|nr:hypothetical protein [Paenibacillus terrae]KJD43382.1 hypothetical protein QD47_23040 [Paenibacillus terrae]
MTQVKDMTDQQLNMQLEILLGAKEDRHRKGNVIKGAYSVSPKDYCTDPAASLEVQTAAIKANGFKYSANLAKQFDWEGEMDYVNDMFHYGCISRFCDATPRERAEAAYMTLSSQD